MTSFNCRSMWGGKGQSVILPDASPITNRFMSPFAQQPLESSQCCTIISQRSVSSSDIPTGSLRDAGVHRPGEQSPAPSTIGLSSLMAPL